jgi:aspartate 1-decarboxylase
MLKSKIHRARVTQLDIDYEGSITIDTELMEESDIVPYEQVQVLNINNGARFTTYAIEGERGSRVIGLNGAAARLAAKGDILIILTYSHVEDEAVKSHVPLVVHVDSKNNITEITHSVEAVTV